MNDLFTIFIVMALVNNIVLSKFLGLCPFFGVSKKLSNAISMGMAVTLVMFIASIATSVIYNYLLVPFNVEFMQIVLYILVIASLVQIVELIIKRTNITLYNSLGIYLPLITTNCAVLGITLINSGNDYNILVTPKGMWANQGSSKSCAGSHRYPLCGEIWTGGNGRSRFPQPKWWKSDRS